MHCASFRVFLDNKMEQEASSRLLPALPTSGYGSDVGNKESSRLSSALTTSGYCPNVGKKGSSRLSPPLPTSEYCSDGVKSEVTVIAGKKGSANFLVVPRKLKKC